RSIFIWCLCVNEMVENFLREVFLKHRVILRRREAYAVFRGESGAWPHERSSSQGRSLTFSSQTFLWEGFRVPVFVLENDSSALSLARKCRLPEFLVDVGPVEASRRELRERFCCNSSFRPFYYFRHYCFRIYTTITASCASRISYNLFLFQPLRGATTPPNEQGSCERCPFGKRLH